jgi:hypothetical protein
MRQQTLTIVTASGNASRENCALGGRKEKMGENKTITKRRGRKKKRKKKWAFKYPKGNASPNPKSSALG